MSWYLLGGNLILSAVLAWFYYRSRYHTVFSYDEDGFEMVRGRVKIGGRWREFGSVSLVHLGGGRFAVRLYKGVGAGLVPARHEASDSVDIPASDLGLNPPQFRFEVMDLLGYGVPIWGQSSKFNISWAREIGSSGWQNRMN